MVILSRLTTRLWRQRCAIYMLACHGMQRACVALQQPVAEGWGKRQHPIVAVFYVPGLSLSGCPVGSFACALQFDSAGTSMKANIVAAAEQLVTLG